MRCINSPSDVTEPQCGKFPKNLDAIGLPFTISHKDAWYVLKSDVLASHQPNAFECFGPEIPVVVDVSFPGD
jgi:hypothetical protein